MIIMKAKMVMEVLYWDKTIKNGKLVISEANVAPAPKAINIAGRAQQISVEEDANNDKKFTDLSSINWYLLL